jgi:2-aminoethylphosphonate-pyruvate transaminase
LDINSHLEKKMTGPYHALASLKAVLDRHDYFREAVVINKRAFTARMAQHLAFEEKHQPLLCTFVRKDISSNDKRAVLYKPRGTLSGSVVCHLGEAHLGRKAQAQILDALIEK